MTPLRTRFIEDMQLHGNSPKTQSRYVGAVYGLAKHYRKSGPGFRRRVSGDYFLHTVHYQIQRAALFSELVLHGRHCCVTNFFVTNTLSIRLEPRLAEALENETAQTGLSKGEIVRQALEERLGKTLRTTVINRHFGVMSGPPDLSTNKIYRKNWKAR